jgi:molybdate transport system ATP-binding protein
MTVRENIAFSYISTPDRPVEAALEVFDLTRLAGKRPAELSGGERQRVAVARAAVAAKDRLLLLDEPFTGLDAPVRDRLIASLRDWLGETPIVSVTHDVAEAFQLDAEIVRLAEGRVVDQGPPTVVLAQERQRLLSLLTEKL